MKKICSMLLACMMILTGLSIHTFAMKSDKIKKLSEKKIDVLKSTVNDVFDGIMNGEEEYLNDRAPLLNGICSGDLLAKYYALNHKKVESEEYLAKMYALKGEMMWFSISTSVDPFKLELYFLQKAVNCLRSDKNNKLRDKLKDLLRYVDEKIKGVVEKSDETKELKMVHEGVPKNEKELADLLENTNEIFETCDDFFEENNFLIKREVYDENCDFINPENDSTGSFDNIEIDKCICSLKIDDANFYSTKEVVKDILKGKCDFGSDEIHIAFGFFKKG